MTNATPGWELYRSFLAVMRTGSLSGAARDLLTTQPTIGRHIEALEKALGTTLFVRTPGGLRPNPVAASLVSHAENMEISAAALIRLASGSAEEIGGAVRLAASHAIGVELLAGILTEFHEQHAQVDIELALSSAPSDLARGEADIAVRMFRPTQEMLIAKRVGTKRIGLFAHKRYVARRGLPHTWSELEQHSLIGFDRDTNWTRAATGLGIELRREMFSLRCDSYLAQKSALYAGFGIGICQLDMASQNQELVPVIPEHFHFDMEVWVAMHRDLRKVRRMALVFEHLVRRLEQHYTAQQDCWFNRTLSPQGLKTN